VIDKGGDATRHAQERSEACAGDAVLSMTK
jgi:hypothetical protein